MNPYEILGLKRNLINPGDVERAHRRLRSEAHPDHNGGDNQKMTDLNMARDILLNPERKRRFDETGSTETGGPTTEEQCIMILGHLFQVAAEQAPDDMPVSQIILGISREIVSGHQKAKERLVELPRIIKRLERMMKKLDVPPVMRKALETRLNQLHHDISTCQGQVNAGDMMLKLVQSVKFR